MQKVIRIGTRDSELALWQANKVQRMLNELGYETKIVPIKSTGDIVLNKPIYALGITGVFTRNLDIALLNNEIDIAKITHKTAAIILETIQGGAGFIEPTNNYLTKVKQRCKEVGALLILDEIQAGIGRTGTFWGFENYNVIPDIIIAGKGLGGGMPIGAFIASFEHMSLLKDNPKLGHISTFAGHPVIAPAANATVTEILEKDLLSESLRKEKLIRKQLQHPKIKEIRGKGLMLIAIVETPELAAKIILTCLEKGLILVFLLFEARAMRITPPLTISDEEIKQGCALILEVLEEVT